MADTVKISGRTFTRAGCAKKKTEAKKRADSIRKTGKLARVKKTGSSWCVFVGPAAKRRAVKKTTTRRRRRA
jgi:hypothetical protein